MGRWQVEGRGTELIIATLAVRVYNGRRVISRVLETDVPE